ncbi:MAG TPA: CehA/McbA family metallohydrolase [Phycisphaerae bacterium]|nr:CehA/McbA family metallohydrolase [Phycisphaerae bacterium]HOJ75220.1 CehA/McbA family metallohydrolase [Phycisphaerae bacterium]HOM52429.1 CehA/McbA family metallohydrolase [Phycisphaerae bacterium]HPP27703.1 CehA/McbA family metallohydrolase [Phycisphaerae bacterium]HPZ98002.1 CehA/McbA family metallohydrolase [Phycisphaerae bacterium]
MHSKALVILVGLVLFSPASAPATPELTNPDELVRLAGRLLQEHPYLLKDADRAKLDELHRKARQALDRVNRAQDDAAKRQAKTRLLKAAAALVPVLESSPNLIRLDLQPDRPVLPPLGTIECPSDIGAMLIRARITGSGADDTLHAVVRHLDLSGMWTESSTIPTDIAPSGTSLVLIPITNVPKDRTSQRLELRAGDRAYRAMLELRSPPRGRLKLTVLGDTGTPTPAMVRLVWKFNNQPQPITNAVDIKSQFDSQGSLTNSRNYVVQGRVAGEYYCMPGPVDMEVPAGEWEIAVRRGIEHVPVYDSFRVSAGETVEKTYAPRRWEDMRKRGWWSGDDHVHARILSDDDARRLMTYAQAEDVHLCNVVKMGDIYRTWFDQRGFGPEYRIVDGDYVLCPGQECPRTHDQMGHTISMNIKRMVRDTDQYYLYDKVFDQVHADGGLCGYAHVSSGMFHVHRDMSVNVPKGKVDFAEVLQFAGLGLDIWYRFLNSGFKITASAGSDIPWGGTLGEVRVYAYLGDQPFTADAWFEAMRKGRTFVTNGPMLEFQVDDALPGDELVVKTDRKVRVKARAWGDPERVWPAKLVVVQHGREIQVVESAEPKKELTIDMELDAGGGFWIAAHAVGNSGEHAHCTPVYVVRPGLRFWKYDEVDKLVGQALDSLGQIEKIVADARERDAKGELEDDRTLKQLALQGPALLERVAEARSIWEELRKVAEQEAPLRAKLAKP